MAIDPYCYPGTSLLRNRLGITPETSDGEIALANAEAELSAARLLELQVSPVRGSFDLAHLQAIHRRVFGDVYTWAGELRTVSLAKGDILFAEPPHVASYARELFEHLADEHWLSGLPKAQFARRAAFYLGEVNMLHPFREGNGRSQRAFFGQLAHDADWHLAWDRVSVETNIEASRRSGVGDDGPLEALIAGIVEPLRE
jgi:cell filamentation protein